MHNALTLHAIKPNAGQAIARMPDGGDAIRLSFEFDHSGGQASVPEWVQIVPFGPFVEARDGRSFRVVDASEVIARSELPMLVDWEHASEGFLSSTRAAAWIEQFAIEDGTNGRFPQRGIWGFAKWTADGAKDVASRAYRFLSPVLHINAETREVKSIISVALTNKPALVMHGLDSFREQFSIRHGLSPSSVLNSADGVDRVALRRAGLSEAEIDEAIAYDSARSSTRTRTPQTHEERRAMYAVLQKQGMSAEEIAEAELHLQRQSQRL